MQASGQNSVQYVIAAVTNGLAIFVLLIVGAYSNPGYIYRILGPTTILMLAVAFVFLVWFFVDIVVKVYKRQ